MISSTSHNPAYLRRFSMTYQSELLYAPNAIREHKIERCLRSGTAHWVVETGSGLPMCVRERMPRRSLDVPYLVTKYRPISRGGHPVWSQRFLSSARNPVIYFTR